LKMDISQYLDVFLEESKEHLGNLNEQLLNLEKNPGNLAALNEIFRAAHTLKGMSSTMGFEDLADLTHHLEDVLSDLKEGLLQPDTYVVDTLFQCLDRVQSIISQIESNGSAEYNNQDLIAILNSIKNQNYTGDIQLIEDKQKPATAQTEEPSIELDFNEYELTVMEEAACKNYQIAAIRVAVDPGSLMKSVRAFMVFKVLEEDSEVIKSIPAEPNTVK
jgi:two-component system chemotaxis sensor kinase CheA